MKEITIVIPNYNGMKFLQDCLQSLVDQGENAPEYEIILVDNGSNDGSCDFVKRKFPQVRMIPLKANTGFCHAVNVGIRKSKTPYVILLNNDTKVKPGFVSLFT